MARFAVPVIEKSKNELNFRLDIGIDRSFSFLQGKFNTSFVHSNENIDFL